MDQVSTRTEVQHSGTGIRIDVEGPVRVVTLDRPASLNAIDREMHTELSKVWKAMSHEPEARAVVLTGSGSAFSGGGDLRMVQAVGDDPVLRAEIMREARDIIREMLDFPLPVVAAINGAAVGLGCSMAMLCDVVLMAEDAYLADPHVAIGLVAGDGGAAMWPLLASPLKVKEFLLTGDRISAPEAARIGMATRVVPTDELLGEAMRVASRLALLPAQAVQDTKRAVNLHLTRRVAGVLDFALAAETVSIDQPEHRDRVRHLLERQAAGRSRLPTVAAATTSRGGKEP